MMEAHSPLHQFPGLQALQACIWAQEQYSELCKVGYKPSMLATGLIG